MRENVTGIRGEFRELTPKETGDFVRSLRKLHETKRLVLADEAGISEKSLERLVLCNIEIESRICYESVCLEQPSDCRGPSIRNCRRECVRGCCAPVTCAARG